jgi:acetyl-CoA acetyltransferase
MRDVFIAGVGMTRFGKFIDSSVRTLTEEAVGAALKDAGPQPPQVESIFFGNAIAGLMTGQEMIRGQAALRNTGLLGVPLVNVENACASSSTAFNLGWLAVASGSVDTVLVVGAEKMSHLERGRAMGALASAVDLEELAALSDRVGDRGPGQRSFFMDLYADTARRYMATTGASAEDFAAVTVKNRGHGALNPHAQWQQAVTVEEVLASRSIVDPLTLLMCSAIADGAAAVVLSSAERLSGDRAPLRVSASVLTSGQGQDTTAYEQTATYRASRRAYEIAGIGPEDLDLVELHDAAAPAELVVYEELGLCAPGDGPGLLRSGATALGGRIPVNVSGGLLAKGHPVGATGCAQVVEISDQLWGRAGARQVQGARIGLAENGGGYVGTDSAALTIAVIERR